MSSIEELTLAFSNIGFDDNKTKEIVKNKKISNNLYQLITIKSHESSVNSLNSQLDSESILKLSLIVDGIYDERLKTVQQINASFEYIKSTDSPTREELDSESGVGIEVTLDDVREKVKEYIKENLDEINEKRYRFLPTIINSVKNLPSLKWANPASLKPVIDEEILKVLGPKDERDIIKKEKDKKNKQSSGKNKNSKNNKNSSKDDNKNVTNNKGPKRSMFNEGFLGDLHKVGENPQMYPELTKEHLIKTGGKVHTRFPPEPNGFLHIGHSKAIMVNFGFAKYHNGVCYLRYDDTNPEAEEEVYFKSILEMVEWLGFKPWKITYSSDYFDVLYEFAERLIENGKAYVDHSTAEEIKEQRGVVNGTVGNKRFGSKWRDRSVEENLKEFRRMRDGYYKVGEATLRMKQDLENPNPQMWDLIAYRVLNASHHRTGDKWKIYPTYDFTHCLCDMLENITHSLCTTEFYLSRESYEWLCDALKVYRPAQREYGRLNITGTIMSKRKISKLVSEKYVRGWDDPRLYTLEGIKRRGIPPGAILSFISTLGVTTSTTNIQAVRFESSIRKYLEDSTARLMMILDPIEIILENLDDKYQEKIEIPFKSGKGNEFGSREILFGNKIYIDRSDFREQDDKEFYRLTLNQSVGLIKVPYTIRVNHVEKDKERKIVRVYCHYENDLSKFKKPKTYIQWIPENEKIGSPIRVKEVRIHNQLFKSENPSSNPDGFLADINPESEEVINGAIIEPAFKTIKENSPYNIKGEVEEFNVAEKPNQPESVRFQALRVGYFCMDRDSSGRDLILNRIVSLKEDSNKK
ncbi:glutamine--tRNA ligase [Ascoidea rubescens DSM 1968]|uniref:glutamine--tRNA ligase n=1 Tax=Ascoidea rubescens DSM 1968 TaxID=1344418 RepID=A0A1D2VK22_9ASCO|nr:glutaminyl-tRNA synthetase [Ascoidea rubescens DSM 1968]ODV61939.1 glutaminyl-tRNA synthetase [Ascoidea rubescens DSM 1968]